MWARRFRKGGLSFDAGVGRALAARLRQHARSIQETANLALADFHYRALTVDDIWIPLGENVVIERFQPLWNRVIDGFGNKTPGRRRAGQRRSCWDALHPGREFVKRLELADYPLTVDEIMQRIGNFFEGKLPPSELLSRTDEEANEI
jgi:hypothetical protein